MDDLGRRAVACARWQWCPGMRTVRGERVLDAGVEGEPWVSLILWRATAERWQGATFADTTGACLPDLTDRATVGCLLALVREVYGNETWTQEEEGWTCWVVRGEELLGYEGATEAEALVAALEAA